METTEVKVGAIHDIEGAGFGGEQVQDIDIMQFAAEDVNECGDIATQGREGYGVLRPILFFGNEPTEIN